MILVWVIRLSLWLLPFRMVRNMTDALAQRIGTPEKANRRFLQKIVFSVQFVSQFIPKATCLTQALATQVLFRRYNQKADLCLGVAHGQTGQLEAHAWVESEGIVVIGGTKKELQRYSRLPAFEKQRI